MLEGEAARGLARLHALVAELGRLGELGEELEAIARAAASLHGAGSACISLYEPVTGAPETTAHTGVEVHDAAVQAVPIRGRHGRALGMLSVRRAHPGEPGGVELEVAAVCARLAADAIEAARSRQALREAERSREELVATLAHELRNPLAPIRNAVHLLALAPEGSPAAAEARTIIERQTSQLVRLLDDLLDVARMSTGKLALRTHPAELASVVAAALETSRPLIEGRRQVLRTRLPGERLVVTGDSLRLAQVISTLLNNAAKYTAENGLIELSVRRERSQAVIGVRDNGVGIEPAMLPRVFDLFAQAGAEQGEGGLGVGLTLARRLVLLHGGSIEARSAGRGRGSEFLVRLPLISRARPAPALGPGLPHRRPEVRARASLL